MASDVLVPTESSASADAPAWTRPAGVAVVVAGLLLVELQGGAGWVQLTGGTLVLGFGLPLILASYPSVARKLLPVVVVLLAIAAAWMPYHQATSQKLARDRTHDGGVYVTREAAHMVLRGENPYVERFDRALPPSWKLVQGSDDRFVPNPVVDHEPYLPPSFLINVPFVAASDVVGITWDTRVLAWFALVAVMVALARRPGPAWARLGAVLTFASAFTLVYLAWGTNDSMAVCCFVGALLLAEDRPGWAGALLAVAISYKFLFLVAVPPLVVVLVARHGWAGLRRWWTAPAVLVATSIGFFAAAPGAFVEDVLWFNLGRTKPLMPTSGMGLPATHPGLFHGPLLGAVTLVGVAVAVGLVPWLAHRYGSIALVGPLTSLALLGILVPARTFQGNYLVLVVGSLATGWWLVPADADAPAGARDDLGTQKRGSGPESGNLESWSNVPPPAPSPMPPVRTSSRTSTAG